MAVGKKLNIGVIGTGRMGSIHARNLAYSAPRANLIAVADPDTSALNKTCDQLPETVTRYTDAEALLKHSGLEAVLIACATDAHPSLTIRAIELGLHVLCEKPLSLDLKESAQVLEVSKTRPDLKLMIAFSRRFDESYNEAYQKLSDIGDVYLVRSATLDKYDDTGFFVQYSAKSGGIYVDCGIHDIDMARWMVGAKDLGKHPVKRVFAQGSTKFYPELAKTKDADNALGLIEFAQGKMCSFHLSRVARVGHECFTEVYGSKGKFVINQNPDMNRLTVMDEYGVRRESTQTYYDRFKEAFVNEANVFVNCCLNDTEPPLSLEDGLEALKIAVGLTMSYHSGKPAEFDDNGYPIEPRESKL